VETLKQIYAAFVCLFSPISVMPGLLYTGDATLVVYNKYSLTVLSVFFVSFLREVSFLSRGAVAQRKVVFSPTGAKVNRKQLCQTVVTFL